MASPTFGSAAVTAGAGPFVVDAYAVTVPSGMAADEVALAFLFTDPDTQAVTVPTGFTLSTSVACTITSKKFKVWLAWKRATGADAGTYTWNGLNGATWGEGLCVRVSGCVTSGDPIDIAGSGALTVSGTTGPAVSVTTTVTDTLLLLFTGVYDAKNQTAATGFTEGADSNDDIEVCWKAQAAAGSSGNAQTTWTTATAAASILVALKSTTSAGASDTLMAQSCF